MTQPSSPERDSDDILMPSSSCHAGQLADCSCRRSICIIPKDERPELISESDTHATVDYFYHEGKFWRAIIPLGSLLQISGQAFNFSEPKTNQGEILFNKHGLPQRKMPFLNHVQCRFTLKPKSPVQLFPLGSEQLDTPDHEINDFIYSLEAVGPVGVNLNLKDGVGGDMLSMHRFVSMQESVFERVVVEGMYVTESAPLPIREHEMRALLTIALTRSHQAGTSEPYYLYKFLRTNNCVSSAFKILDSVIQYRWFNKIGSMLYRLPLNPRFYLWVRGLDSDTSFRKLMRNEFADYIQDEKTQLRKEQLDLSNIAPPILDK
ncbi:MAG: hypothetical protein COA78_36035 [Blastopirellula sp.]|nr:MAG: hypothetical protein COA78_36035 [Blastopirellula sp.]